MALLAIRERDVGDTRLDKAINMLSSLDSSVSVRQLQLLPSKYSSLVLLSCCCGGNVDIKPEVQ